MINNNRLFYLRSKGLNMQEIANQLGVTRITIQRHFTRFKQMSDEEFKALFKEAFI